MTFILETIARLSALGSVEVQGRWLTPENTIATLNENNYITWAAGHQEQWLKQTFVVPSHINGYSLEGLSLRLCLAWWAQKAEIFVDDALVQEGDLFDSSTRILLRPSVTPGETIDVSLRLVSPGHDIGGLMKSVLVYEALLEPGFIADELRVLHNYLKSFSPGSLEILEEELKTIDWDSIGDREKFDRSLLNLRQSLQPLAADIKNRTFNLLGHAHLDLAWLWPLEETWDVAYRTFTSVINLQKDYHELKFGHSSPIIYEWIETHHPELFDRILEAYKDGRWEILGPMWVEPEVNLISGESLVRQLLYGQKYFQKTFGTLCKVAWLPDSFGFPWQLPQILSLCGVQYFVTAKLHWNDTTKFPHGWFWWQSPDGSRIPTLMSPPNVAGVMDTNPIIMTDYAVDWEKQTRLKEIFWLPGVGDHGGGPTRDMLDVYKRWQSSPFFPKLRFQSAEAYLNSLSMESLPVWNDELYLEFHRGCYTTHAEQKERNRRNEILLYEAELWASLAAIVLNIPFPKEDIESAWKKVLLNQFHDILPGTSIPEVFVTADSDWRDAAMLAEDIFWDSLENFADNIALGDYPHPEAVPIVMFNSLNWERSGVGEIAPTKVPPGKWRVYNADLQPCSCQVHSLDYLLFKADRVPGIGYKLFWLIPDESAEPETLAPDIFSLENQYLKVVIDPETGNIRSIFDKIEEREVLSGPGNALQMFRDSGQYWSAWNIDPNYEQFPLEAPQLTEINFKEWGPLEWTIETSLQWRDSRFWIDYTLELDSPLLKISCNCHWNEKEVLVKAAFPLRLKAQFTGYEIACGAIERTNRAETPAEKAKWEVYAHKWVDMTDPDLDYGVSILNDCKYGYDSTPDRLRITLLRSSIWPDPNADKRFHCFTYCIYPHRGNWQGAGTVKRAHELNNSLSARQVPHHTGGQLPPENTFLDLGGDNLILMAFKPKEDEPSQYILRCYESEGKEAKMVLKTPLNLEFTGCVDCLEETVELKQQVKPWQISNFSYRTLTPHQSYES
ncbi:MAG: hypothetical protein N5P05_001222 [Chroococcopsis gigantea SAG 12.99]|jgi:alpha-mannosidase|nr:alpha-mannosidase [Chlorogloea purpurea SAG 13.99]MDV2999616.1 hypothetical protein [Chroococcopsis gigantea SAG 12.99]